MSFWVDVCQKGNTILLASKLYGGPLGVVLEQPVHGRTVPVRFASHQLRNGWQLQVLVSFLVQIVFDSGKAYRHQVVGGSLCLDLLQKIYHTQSDRFLVILITHSSFVFDPIIQHDVGANEGR